MSLGRAIALVGAAFVVAFVVLSWRSQKAASGGPEAAAAAQAPITASVTTSMSAGPRAPSPAPSAAPSPAPSLPDQPFAGRELEMTSDSPDAPVVALRSSSLSGRDLSIELATRAPAAEGKRVFATVSVSDALGNTLIDCTWRDVDLTDDAQKLDCALPVDVALPLTISGHQRSSASFVENPTVVAVDKGVQP
ncbi:MAG TPA: hypothetical protein VLM79_32475 [Kofleriaceae bacterium]|nr:hypothetical protein [Kofleriaceae bacterium]